jgi:hypothetical protein
VPRQRLLIFKLLERRVLQKFSVHLVSRDLHVPDDRAAYEAALDRGELREALLVDDLDLLELDVEVLVDRVQRADERQVVLQLDHDLLPHKRLEEREENHCFRGAAAAGSVCAVGGGERERERGRAGKKASLYTSLLVRLFDSGNEGLGGSLQNTKYCTLL